MIYEADEDSDDLGDNDANVFANNKATISIMYIGEPFTGSSNDPTAVRSANCSSDVIYIG